jgi:hypothetical protein
MPILYRWMDFFHIRRHSGQVKFNALAKFATKGGKTEFSESGISVSNAHEVMILISMATNFTDYKTLNTDEVAKARKYIEAAEKKFQNFSSKPSGMLIKNISKE